MPDLSGWRRERLPQLPEEAYSSTDRAVKMPIYAEQSVQWLWLVDPDNRILEVYRLLDGHWLLEHTRQNDDVIKAPPFDQVSKTLSDLWVPEPKA